MVKKSGKMWGEEQGRNTLTHVEKRNFYTENESILPKLQGP